MKTPSKKANVLLSPNVNNSTEDKRKRLSEMDDVDLDIEPPSKRLNISRQSLPKSKSKLKEVIIDQRMEKVVQSSPTPKLKSFQPGEKTALLAAIRMRINELEGRTVYIRNIPRYTTEAQLKKFCPTSIAIKLSSRKRGGHRRGHAFMEFKSEQAARAAVESTNGKLIADRPINLQMCSKRLHDPPKSNWIPADRRQLAEFSLNTLAVSCVPRVTNNEDLQKLFPASESIEIVQTANKIPTGLCIIRFVNDVDALEAFTTQHDAKLHGTPLIVNFAYKKGYSNRRNVIPPASISLNTSVENRPPKHHDEAEISAIHPTQKAFVKNKTALKKKNTDGKPKHQFPPKELNQPLGKVKTVGKRM